MNIVLIVTDSFRFDNLSAYGKSRLFPERGVDTPCLDRFAEQATLFERAYFSSFPTVPTRRDIMTGYPTFVSSGWAPLPENEVVVQQVLSARGYATMLIADTPHILQRGYNYQRGFDGFEWIRGQENDHWRTHPREVTMPCDPAKLRSPEYTMVHYLRNTSGWKTEEDRFCARTMQAAVDWLETSASDTPFFLWVETFDPHEPWDPPQADIDRYDPGYTGEPVTYPRYAPTGYLSEAELNHCRARYAGESTLVDRWIGKVLDKINALGLADDTAVIVTTDHGFGFGDHGIIGKSVCHDDGHWEVTPFFEEIAHVPLLVRMPGQTQGKRIPALVGLLDLTPTILELAGVVETEAAGKSKVQVRQCGIYREEGWQLDPERLKGASLVPLLEGQIDRLRDIQIVSASLNPADPYLARSTVICDDGWSLFYNGNAPAPADWTPFYPTRPQLFYLPDDPCQEHDLFDKERSRAEELHRKMLQELERYGTPAETLKTRNSLP